MHGLVSCLIKIANDLDEEMSVEPREAYYRIKKHKNSGFQRTMRITKKFDKPKRTEKSGKSIGDILLENGHICNSPSGICFSLGRPYCAIHVHGLERVFRLAVDIYPDTRFSINNTRSIIQFKNKYLSNSWVFRNRHGQVDHCHHCVTILSSLCQLVNHFHVMR